jgi:hypothetical protein
MGCGASTKDRSYSWDVNLFINEELPSSSIYPYSSQVLERGF